jgi:hypothetical protein
MARVPDALVWRPSAAYLRLVGLRHDRLGTFLDGQRFPWSDPLDPTRVLWVVSVPLEGSDRHREVFTIRPVDEPMPVGLDDGGRWVEIRRFPYLVMPVDCDAFALLGLDRSDSEGGLS